MDSHVFTGILLGIIGVSCVLILAVYPWIFWLYIIPCIQKRVRKKFTYDPKYEFYSYFGRYSAYMDVAFSIFLRCVNMKMFNNQNKYRLGKSRPLETVSYDIKEASRIEIVTSVMFVVNCALMLFSFILIFITLWLHDKLYYIWNGLN